jgi:hypothetical protein
MCNQRIEFSLFCTFCDEGYFKNITKIKATDFSTFMYLIYIIIFAELSEYYTDTNIHNVVT